MTFAPPQNLAAQLAARIRERLADGRLQPGQHLSETALAATLGASRNSLREAFRLLSQEGLLRHAAHRGVTVARLSAAQIVDIYRARRLIECQALRHSYPDHPAVAAMAAAVALGEDCGGQEDWRGVAAANRAFHAAIVACADSPRLSEFHHRLAAELGLAFAALPDAAALHRPYIARNAAILAEVRADQPLAAAARLEQYLLQSERAVLAAHAGTDAESGSGFG